MIGPAEVAAAIGGNSREGDGYVAFCPLHEADGKSHNPSLILSEGHSKPVIGHCRAGCCQDDINAAVDEIVERLEAGETVTPIESKVEIKKSGNKLHARILREGAPTDAYQYDDIDGNYVVTKIRWEAVIDGRREKTFQFCNQQLPATSPSAFRMPEAAAMPLYNAHALRDLESDDLVVICEGEKDANTMLGLDYVAVSTHNGVAGWSSQSAGCLQGRHVAIVPDNDDAGHKYAKKVIKALSPFAKSVKVIELPGLKDKGDVTDWVDAGGTEQQFWELYTGQSEEDLGGPNPEWRTTLSRNAQGAIRSNDFNLNIMLSRSPEFHGLFRYNHFQNVIELWRAIPGSDDTGPFPRVWQDTDETDVLVWAQRAVFPSMARSKIMPAVQAVAADNGYDPLVDYLDMLAWDGEERLDCFLQEYLGAEGVDRYISAVGRMWAISAVARAYQPGCQVDTMLVLEGRQGLYKSSALRALVPHEEWFSDDISSMRGDKDDKLALFGRMIIEIKELEALRKAEIGAIKSFIDTRVDKIRVPYGRSVQSFPRRCVMAGSYNPTGHGYLKDASGGRRFWPVTIKHLADIDGLLAIRDQLWAEAVVAYKTGEKWWTFDRDLMKLIEAEQEERYQVEPIEELVHSYIDNECLADDQDGAHNIRRSWIPRKEPLDTFFTHNFCEDVLLRSWDQVRRPDLNIIGQAMTRIGWTKGKLWNARISKTSTGWKRPDTENRPHPPRKTTSPSDKIAAKSDAQASAALRGKVQNAAVETENVAVLSKTSPSDPQRVREGEVKGEVLSYSSATEKGKTSPSSPSFPINFVESNEGLDTGVYIKFWDTEGEVGLHDARSALKSALDDGIVGFDLETTGLSPVDDSRARLMQVWRDDHCHVFDLDVFGGLEAFGDLLEGSDLVAFNALFEMRWLRAADIDVVPHDLMLAWSAVYGGTLKITLEHVVKELLGVELDKTMQKSDWSGELTKDQIQYAFDDAYFTLMAWRKLTGIMAPEQVAGYELFKNSQRPVMRMMEAGVGFDIDGHAELLSRFERKFIWAEDWLARHVPDVKNWSSSSQVAKWLNDSLPENVKGRWPRTEKTLAMKTGADACKQFILDVDRDLRRVFWAYQILQTYRKYISTYGEKLVRNHYRDRRLYGNFRIGRAITGRMASEKPNLQNMPGRGPIGAAFRSLFIAPPGSRLVIADYSQIEVRVGGILADEPAFKEMFERGYDVHAATAALMLGKEYDEVFDSEKKSVRPEYKHARSAAKEITFGMQYGMGDRTLASKLNLTVREARQEIRKWEENFPKVTEWREKSAEYGARNKGLVMPSGRTITLDYRPSPQACYNYPVQGTAGDVMYAALVELDRRLDEADIDAVPLLVVHDEIVLEAAEEDAEEAARILEEAMVAGFRKLFPNGGINNLVEASVCSTWADKS